MEPQHKKILKAIVLELRHLIEGLYDGEGKWHPGDLEQRLAAIGIRRDRNPVPIDELPHLSDEDKNARKVVEAYLTLRQEAGISSAEAVAEFVRETAYTWSNRLLALRCMEARELIDEVILQKDIYGGRSLEHHRLAQRKPECCTGEDDGLFAILEKAFTERAKSLPILFHPRAPGVALSPSTAALKHCIKLLSGTQVIKGQEPATSEVFKSPDVLGWAYQYYQQEDKKRIDDLLKTQKGFKCEGADIIPKTALYTEPYMVKFLVQNSLGATWMGMHPESKLFEKWEYYVRDADRAPIEKRSIREITFLDPAPGSGHFLLEAFNLFFDMYVEEGGITNSEEICRSILENNLYGIDIDERAIQIAEVVLWMKAAEKAPNFAGTPTNLVATNIHLPKGKDHLKEFLRKHPEDEPLRPALEIVFESLEHADELGSLLRIEEPVEKELRHLKTLYETKKDELKQDFLWSKMAKPVQGKLPIDVEDYNNWKIRTLLRLKEHFEAEADSSDLGQAFFSQSVGKGLSFFELLARRYDVVATNPPYMGSKNMGPVLKNYIERDYSPGKRDLYAAFIMRCCDLSANNGLVSMVTQEGWTFLNSFAPLRNEPMSKSGLLWKATLLKLAHLGSGAFEEISGEVVRVVLIILSTRMPQEDNILWAVRLTGHQPTQEKDRALIRCATQTSSRNVFRPKQIELRNIPTSPIAYWLPESALKLMIEATPLGKKYAVSRGVDTCNNNRFVRMFWEHEPIFADWPIFLKGGGYGKWAGQDQWILDYRNDGIRVKSYVIERFPYLKGKSEWLVKTDTFNKHGWAYSLMAQGALGVRYLRPDQITSNSTRGVFTSSPDLNLGPLLNSRLSSFILRTLSSDIKFSEGYVALLPVIDLCPDVEKVVSICIHFKEYLLSLNLTDIRFSSMHERHLDGFRLRHNIEYWDIVLASTSILLLLEGYLEFSVLNSSFIDNDFRLAVLEQTGTPAGWFPLIGGIEAIPPSQNSLPGISKEVINYLAKHERLRIDQEQLGDLKRRLRLIYEAGTNIKRNEDENESNLTDDENEDERMIVERIPIPQETFLEELSQKLEIHPISIYLLVKEGIEKEGWRCLPEERRITADRITLIILRFLGHRWPKQIEAGEPVPEWADKDGIVPLTEGTGESILLSRVRERIMAQFNNGNATVVEREFAEVMEQPLELWLESEFFKQHIKQFKKRPIAWQIQSSSYTRRKKPAYACMIYYHKLDGDLLPKVLSHHVIPLRQRFETELRMIEGVSVDARNERQDKRRVELEALIQEVNDFEAGLQKVSTEGFTSVELRQNGIDDAMLNLKAAWLRRLSGYIKSGPLRDWRKLADGTHLECPLAEWIEEAFLHLEYFCSAVGPKPPKTETLSSDPDSLFFARMINREAKSTVKRSVELACEKWWKIFDEIMLSPLREQIRNLREEIKKNKMEIKEAEDSNFDSLAKLKARTIDLENEIKQIQKELSDRTDGGKKVRKTIEEWRCPEAETWEDWLAKQPMYDAISSLDGKRTPPLTIYDFVRQEAFYAPDINDGVRVNIVPLQKAGLLAADVLAKKDLDKAIEDRAEWRSDERRWCREGKLPQPGWWKAEKD